MNTAYHSRLKTPLCELLSCDYPILQAGMGGVARAELVAAVSNAGGYGFLGMVREPVKRIQAEINQVRQQTDKPFGVNLIPAATDGTLLQQQINLCIQNNIHSVCLFWDINEPVIARFREAGILVFHQVGNVVDAVQAWHAGADILIVQGHEAGGHVRATQSLFTLLPEIARATPLPVVASGGIVSGQGMLAAIMLGAQGIHCGTLFLATHESNAHDFHKQAVVQASPQDTLLTELFHINWPKHAPVRVIQNSVTRGTRSTIETDPVIGIEGNRPIYLYSTDSPLKETEGELEAMALYAGQGVSLIDDIVSAKIRIDVLMKQASTELYAIADNTPYIMHSNAIELTSPPCLLSDSGDQYAGYWDKPELVAFLNKLLEGERAGAKIAARSIKICGTAAQRQLLENIFTEEVRCCELLMQAIRQLGGEHSRHISDFYDRTMSIPDIKERLHFLNRGQQWVTRQLDEAFPAIRDEALHAKLCSMRHNHNLNIVEVSTLLNQ